ncbi:MAG: DUF1059 domain-containing protein [Candidatus Thorarchaeota archaeon]|jgi:predicted small metal-binding protein
MYELKCNDVVPTGCKYVSKGATKEEAVADMMKHGGEVHSDLMKATTEAEVKKAKQEMEKKMHLLLE